MTARAIMLLGTGSDVGKSLIAAGLCRLLSNRGHRVRPFKPQNMSNNAAVTVDGGEIGRAQALQARAARAAPTVHMNPVLLKPESATGAQIIVQGQRTRTLSARDYFADRRQLMPSILESFRIVASDTDFVIVEGAGSPAETNLRDGDLANMGFAEAADIPAILIGDIHRGGVIASIVGTFAVLSAADASRIKGFLINNFRGDVSLFTQGAADISERTGVPCLGIVPFFPDARRLPAEDAVALENAGSDGSGALHVAALKLPRIANFDDLDPLRSEPDVRLTIVQPGSPIPGDARLVIIPGSKSTVADLKALRAEGWDIDITAHLRRGGAVIGLCGGYQMLGRRIHDPDGLEGPPESVDGLAILDIETTLRADKTLSLVDAVHIATGESLRGYEIHLGSTAGPDCDRPFARIDGRPDGAISRDGRVTGTYLHGAFASDRFRSAFLRSLGAATGDLAFDTLVDETLDALANHLERHIDIDRLLPIARPVKF